MAATQYVDIIGSGFVSGVPNFYANCRVYYDGTQILHVGPLYVNWPAPPPPVRAGVSVDVTAFGAAGNGTSDDTAAIQAAINAVAATAGAMGEVHLSAGIYISTGNTLASNVSLRGDGPDATILKLKAGANTDLLSANTSSINLSASYGTGSTGGVFRWGIRNMTLDGNKANQSSGPSWCVRVYGYAYLLDNVIMRNGYSGGMQGDWNGGSNGLAPNHDAAMTMSNCEWSDHNGIGLQLGGPSDSRIIASNSHENASHGFHFGPNASAMKVSECHSWGSASGNLAVAWLVEGSFMLWTNNVAEGADQPNIVLLGNECTVNGRIFHGTASNWVGIQLGQNAGGTPFPGSVNQSAGVTTAVTASYNRIDSDFNECRGGAINFVNETNNVIDGRVYQTAGVAYAGSPSVTDNFLLSIAGLTADGSQTKSTNQTMRSNAFKGLVVGSPTNDWFNVDTYDGVINILNGANLVGISDNYVTTTWQLRGGTLCYAQSATTPDPGNNGTITTAGVGLARVTPAANRTGVILQAGTQPGQHVAVVNNSASFTVQFAASGTSHVALGTGLTIAVNGKQVFVWDSVAALWY